MKPYVLVHETPKGVFSPPKTNDIVYYHSPRGYMTYELFYKIVSGVFVEYVENVRRSNGFGRKKGCFGYRHNTSGYALVQFACFDTFAYLKQLFSSSQSLSKNVLFII